MTDEELRKLAAYIVSEQARNKDWMAAYAEARKGVECDKRYLSLKEAAMAIGMSVSWLYKHKDEFSYEKSGDSKSSVLMFNKQLLLNEYEDYLTRGRKIIKMEPLRMTM